MPVLDHELVPENSPGFLVERASLPPSPSLRRDECEADFKRVAAQNQKTAGAYAKGDLGVF